MKIRRGSIAAVLALLAACPTAAAAPQKSVVPHAALASTSVDYKVGAVAKHKTIFCLKRTPGDAKAVSGGYLFTPYSYTIAQLKARRVGGTKLASYVQLNSAGRSACAKIPSHIGTPTPTPTPSPSTDNFDSGGNLTERGKIMFGVPSSLSGNISTGRSLVLSYCTCHQERLGAGFPYVRTNIALSPMLFDSTQITDAMLANMVAYLNRFTLH